MSGAARDEGQSVTSEIRVSRTAKHLRARTSPEGAQADEASTEKQQ